jgi:hypothetical protein
MQNALMASPASDAVETVRSEWNVLGLIREILEDIQADYIADKRADPRCPVCIPIEVIPYNDQGQRTGEPFLAATTDVSAGGIAFLHTAAFVDRFAALRFPQARRHAGQRIVVEVVHCSEVGPFWQIGGRFMVEW